MGSSSPTRPRKSPSKVRALQVKAGDRVLFAKYSETEVKVDGETLLLMREDDLLGIIER